MLIDENYYYLWFIIPITFIHVYLLLLLLYYFYLNKKKLRILQKFHVLFTFSHSIDEFKLFLDLVAPSVEAIKKLQTWSFNRWSVYSGAYQWTRTIYWWWFTLIQNQWMIRNNFYFLKNRTRIPMNLQVCCVVHTLVCSLLQKHFYKKKLKKKNIKLLFSNKNRFFNIIMCLFVVVLSW